MRFATAVFLDGSQVVGRVDDGAFRPLRGLTEIGPSTGLDCLCSAELDNEEFGFDDLALAPVAAPGKILCVGLNYREHVDETGRETPEYPVLFPKFASSLIGHGDPIVHPPESHQVDYEAELAVVIGRPARRVARADALQYVMGYTIANDITMRDYQYKTPQWVQGKAWDRSTPLGPVLVTPDEINAAHLDIALRLNGVELQSSNTSLLMFDVARLIEVVSEFTALAPGDVILTGTPGGVGFRRDPQIFLTDGDVVEVEIEGLGILRNPVRDETSLADRTAVVEDVASSATVR